jgi:hypothetical protein
MSKEFYLVCFTLFFCTGIFSQTQYSGPAGGDWFTSSNGLPTAGNDALIGSGASAGIGSSLTVDFIAILRPLPLLPTRERLPTSAG